MLEQVLVCDDCGADFMGEAPADPDWSEPCEDCGGTVRVAPETFEAPEDTHQDGHHDDEADPDCSICRSLIDSTEDDDGA